MNLIELLQMVFKTQLNAKIPKEFAARFKQEQIISNSTRFATQSFVLIIMDLISLLAYSHFYYQSGHIFPYHIAVHIIKLVINCFLVFHFAYLYNHPSKSKQFFNRNSDILFPLIHSILEFFLFASGPQGIGSLIRFMAVPFIAASIPVLQQRRALYLQTIIYTVYSYYLLQYTLWGTLFVENNIVLFINIVLVVFVCANLVSNIVYSSFVNNYVHERRDIQSKNQLDIFNRKLEILSRRDKLTGLSNRRDFDDYIKKTWDKSTLYETSVNALILDIDHFKLYNDRFGHIKGDTCLISVTKQIATYINNEEYMFARFGGEEFIIISHNKNHDDMVALAESIRAGVQALHIDNPDSSVNPFITISIGVATIIPSPGIESQRIIKLADECLYHAKQNGRNRVIHLENLDGTPCGINGTPLEAEQQRNDFENNSYLTDSELEHAVNELNINFSFLYIRKKDNIEISEHASEILGIPRTILKPTLEKCAIYLAEESRLLFVSTLRNCIQNTKKDFKGKFLFNKANGDTSWFYVRGSCSYDANGVIDTISGSFFKISDLLQYFHYVEQQHNVNSVTMLPNRKQFYHDTNSVLANGSSGFILLLDVCNFKSINGIYSHNIGDKVLFEVGRMLSNLLRDTSKLYHYTLDQYIFVMENKSKHDVIELVQLIRQYFAQNDIFVERLSIKISFNIGIVAFSQSDFSLDELMVDMDITIQKVKYNTDGSYSFFDKCDRVSYLENVMLESQLQEACRNNMSGFTLYYQPINNAKTMHCVGAEALLRWRDKEGNIVSPLTLVPILEKIGVMKQVEVWIFAEATRQCRHWINVGAPDDFFVHINLSSNQIARPTLVSEIMTNIQKNYLQPHNIILEVTESSLIAEMQLSIQILNELRSKGIRVAVDDFGTGYSSLSYLRSLPIDEIKVDQSFLRNVQNGKSEKQLLYAIIDMCRSMGYSVCLEGVETKEEITMLKDSKLNTLQGYYFSRPIPSFVFTETFIISLCPPAKIS